MDYAETAKTTKKMNKSKGYARLSLNLTYPFFIYKPHLQYPAIHYHYIFHLVYYLLLKI